MPRYDIESKFRCSRGRVIQQMRAELLRLSNTSTCEDADYNDDKVCVCRGMSQMITQQLTANCDKNNSCQYIMEYPRYGDCLDQVGVPFFLNIGFKCAWLGVCIQYSWAGKPITFLIISMTYMAISDKLYHNKLSWVKSDTLVLNGHTFYCLGVHVADNLEFNNIVLFWWNWLVNVLFKISTHYNSFLSYLFILFSRKLTNSYWPNATYMCRAKHKPRKSLYLLCSPTRGWSEGPFINMY